MADCKSSPSRIPRFKTATKKPKQDTGAARSPIRLLNKICVNPPINKGVKPLIKPPPTEKACKVPMTATLKFANSQRNAAAKPVLQDRRGISEVRRSEKNLRQLLDAKNEDISLLEHQLESLQRDVLHKNDETDSLKQELKLVQEKYELFARENALQAEKLEQHNICPVKGVKLEVNNGANIILNSVRKSQPSIESLLANVWNVSIPDV